MTPRIPDDWHTRPVEDIIRYGVINLDKPQGPSSHQVAVWVKDIFGLEKAGHGGTLDPGVTGVLPVALQDAARAVDALLQGEKEYVCAMKLHGDVEESRLRSTLRDFTGRIYQTPPLRSAVKKELRVRTVHDIDILEVSGRDLLFKIRCQSGTYIRTLCHDAGDALLAGAHMDSLRRTRTASFREEDSVTLQDVRDAFELWRERGDEGPLRKVILPMESLLAHLPRLTIKDTAVDAVCHGAYLALPGLLEAEKGIRKGALVAMFTARGEGVALGTASLDAGEMEQRNSGMAALTTRVLMTRGRYPKSWKSKSKPLNTDE